MRKRQIRIPSSWSATPKVARFGAARPARTHRTNAKGRAGSSPDKSPARCFRTARAPLAGGCFAVVLAPLAEA